MFGRFCAIVVGLLLAGCFSAKSPPSGGVEPPLAAESIFPHKSNWALPEEHGLYVKDHLQYNTTSCAACHGTYLEGGDSGPGCRSCHTIYPHDDLGLAKLEHGQEVVAKGKVACATQCHGTDLAGGLSGVACTQCHAAYPHPAGWALPSSHGPFARGDQKQACSSCHGSDWAGGSSKVSCLNCHKGLYPHVPGWAQPARHGAVALESDGHQCAGACHGAALEGGGAVGCNECHAMWPHPASGNWTGSAHGDSARKLGVSACLGCHTIDPPGGKTGVTCTECHQTLPLHDEPGWEAAGHGQWAFQAGDVAVKKECGLCHGANLEGGPPSPGLDPTPACAACHESYPDLHTTALWGEFVGHGQWLFDEAKTTTLPEAIAQCAVCHGSDLTGGTVNVSCYTCHKSFPHPVPPSVAGGTFAPWLKNHGAYLLAKEPDLQQSSCATANCHGTTLDGNPPNVPVAEKVVPGCDDCHYRYPHPKAAEGKSVWSHGKAVLTNDPQPVLDIAKCAPCHGDDYKGKGNAKSCYECHATYPDPHRTETWRVLVGHGAHVMAAAGGKSPIKVEGVGDCTICHGTDLKGGTSGTSCYASCHPSFPHAPPTTLKVKVGGVTKTLTFDDANWLAFSKGHGSYAAARAKLNGKTTGSQVQSECATACHGADLLTQTGSLNMTCYSCHKNYPHKLPAWLEPAAASGANHGESIIADAKTANESVAKYASWTCASSNCHGAAGQKWGTKKCQTCHAGFPDEHLAPTWDTAAGHGALAKVDAVGCLSCHGIAAPGPAGSAAPLCADCHDPKGVYPHPAGWAKSFEDDPFGGQHGPIAAMNAKAAGCLTACHGTSGQGGFVAKEDWCTACHATYPHSSDWVTPTGAGYAAHGSAMLDTKNTPTKDDDLFDDAKFGECAKCHGGAVPFKKGVFNLPLAEQFMTLPGGKSLPRCTACHKYPHQNYDGTGWGKDWGHIMAINNWIPLSGETAANFVQDTCGTANNGCHTDGPWYKAPNVWAGAKDKCGLCHETK